MIWFFVEYSDQWSPLNPEGKKTYDRLFLLELQHNPASQRKPEGLPNLEVVRDKVNRCLSCFSLVYGSVGLFLIMMIANDGRT